MPINIPNSPPNSGFIPRKEFLREAPSTRNSFALLTVSGSSCARLYSFPLAVVTALRGLFEQQRILLAFREDFAHNLCEFTLDGKPWSTPKAVTTEKLLLDILTVIYHHGYTYLSTIDYGRENDDRLAMAFAIPASVQQGSRSGTPLPPSSSPSFLNASKSSLPDKTRNRRVPFALSFVSATVMRAIAPPLHLTPAILQAVRGSWPRGVVSETKIGENCFEFKLKGYKWFQQDNFAADSLQHILSLLASLDSHSFTLLTSISLTNRSRVKDLWIFTGPAATSTGESPASESLEQSVLDGSHPDLKRKRLNQQQVTSDTGKGITTEISPPHTQYSSHPKAGPEDPTYFHTQQSVVTGTSHMLRKPAPRAQVPVSAVQEDMHEHEGLRIQLPSIISSSVENMTGVGTLINTPELLYASSPYDAAGVASPIQHTVVSMPKPKTFSPPVSRHSPLRPASDRVNTPPLLVPPSGIVSSDSPPPSPHHRMSPLVMANNDTDPNGDHVVGFDTSTPLLGSGTFRDSAFSSNSEVAGELPVTWSSVGKEIIEQSAKNEQGKSIRPVHGTRASSTPMLPGGWQPSPIEEKTEEEAPVHKGQPKGEEGSTPIHEVGSCIDSPELVRPGMSVRKSEAAVVGVIGSAPANPPLQTMPQRPKGQRKESQTSIGGWVLVNVGDGSRVSTPTAVNGGHNASGHSGGGWSSAPGTPNPGGATSPRKYDGSNQLQSPVPPASKAIVIVDAMESKHKKARSSSSPATSGNSSGGVRRFFSLNRKNSKVDMGTERRLKGQSSQSTLPRSGLVERLRLIGMPEASRREDKPRSID